MGTIIAVANQKGGSGKTTTTMSLGASLAELGHGVLMVDMDPQASLTAGCGIYGRGGYPSGTTMYHVLLGLAALPDAVVRVENNFDLATSNIDLAAAELQLADRPSRELTLRNAFHGFSDYYDYILVDCPPSFGLLTLNTLAAAHSVLIPVTADFFTALGLRLMLETVSELKAGINPGLLIKGVLFTRFDRRTRHSREILSETQASLAPKVRVFDITVRESVRFKECPSVGQSILRWAPASDGARSYRQLAALVAGADGS